MGVKENLLMKRLGMIFVSVLNAVSRYTVNNKSSGSDALIGHDGFNVHLFLPMT